MRYFNDDGSMTDAFPKTQDDRYCFYLEQLELLRKQGKLTKEQFKQELRELNEEFYDD